MTPQDRSKKLSTGPNTRPKRETISQTGAGIPDDTGGRNRDIEEAAGTDRKPDEVFEKKKPGTAPEAGKRQIDPAEGDRETVERELDRTSGRKQGRG